MKVTVENISAVSKKMIIEVDADTVDLELAKAVVKLQKVVKIPGFRPGHATRDAIERHKGNELKTEVLGKLVDEAFRQAMKDHKFVAVSSPSIGDVSEIRKGSPLTFTASVDVRPTVELGNYTGIEIENSEITVTEEEVEATIKRMREMHVQLDEVGADDPVEKDHTAIIDFESFHEGQPMPNGKATDFVMQLGMEALLPEFENNIVGMKRGETRDIKVSFAKDYNTPELAGKDVTFAVTLKDIKKPVMPELNDEFAMKVGNCKTMEELRSRLKEDIAAKKRMDLEAKQKDDILAKLIESHSFDVPESLVLQELSYMTEEQKRHMANKPDEAGKAFNEDEFRKNNREMAVKRVKGIVLLQDIADKENIQISENDVSATMSMMARNSGQKLEEIFKYYESQPGGLDILRESLLAQKTLAFLYSKAKKV